MDVKTYFKKVGRINTLPTLEERKNAHKQLGIEELDKWERTFKRQAYKRLFWEVIHNIRDLIVFFILLPFTPIIYIIQTIKEK